MNIVMDEGLSKAVLVVFKKLYDKGYIYKGKRMINWCPNCNTSISDAEVEYEEEPTHLWHIRYKVKDEDIYSVGDTWNDIPMLKEYNGYSMEQGTDDLKEFPKISSVHELIKRMGK